MKQLFCFVFIVTLLATVFSGLLQDVRMALAKDDTATPFLDYLTPAIAYADSDTLYGPGEVPPPPPPPYD